MNKFAKKLSVAAKEAQLTIQDLNRPNKLWLSLTQRVDGHFSDLGAVKFIRGHVDVNAERVRQIMEDIFGPHLSVKAALEEDDTLHYVTHLHYSPKVGGVYVDFALLEDLKAAERRCGTTFHCHSISYPIMSSMDLVGWQSGIRTPHPHMESDQVITLKMREDELAKE